MHALLKSPAGRLFFVTPRLGDVMKLESAPEYPLSKIVLFSEHKDMIRRGGVAYTMK